MKEQLEKNQEDRNEKDNNNEENESKEKENARRALQSFFRSLFQEKEKEGWLSGDW